MVKMRQILGAGLLKDLGDCFTESLCPLIMEYSLYHNMEPFII